MTDYSVGPWDYPSCAARFLMKYSDRKLYIPCTYYAPRGPNLSKLCATCLFLRVTDLGEATLIYLGYSPW
jgi:hypothetical protein